MEKENNRANKYGYKSPICKSKLTDRSFNDCLKHILKILMIIICLWVHIMKKVIF